MKDRISLYKLGRILYEIYDLHNFRIDSSQYKRLVKYIIEALKEIKPIDKPKNINSDIKEFVDETNRRLNNE